MQGKFISIVNAGEEADLVWHMPSFAEWKYIVADILETEVSVTLYGYIVAFVKLLIDFI